jgi:hypothetical protein
MARKRPETISLVADSHILKQRFWIIETKETVTVWHQFQCNNDTKVNPLSI